MSGIILNPKSVHTVKAPSYVILTVIYVAVLSEGAGNPKPIIRNGEGGVLTHSMGWR
jgi:hypothetical protein